VQASDAAGPGFALRAEGIGALPVVDHFLDRLRLAELLGGCLPAADARSKLAPAKAIGVAVRNLAIGHQPIYALGEWAASFDPRLLGLSAGEAGLLNDDRVGRALAALFDADRASLLARLVLDAVDRFGIDCSQLHNDSTSVRLSGAYRQATGERRAGKPTPAVARGHSKDHRPDLGQLVWILTVTADGAVPICHQVADGNTEDSTTHIGTWDRLTALLGRTDFRYVADCKLATRANMDHIDHHGGRFVTVCPATRAEDGAFRRWLTDHDPDWAEALSRPARRLDEPDDVYATTEAPWPSAEGYRVIWVRSTAKLDRDAESRRARVAAGIAALDALNTRLASPKTRIKTALAAEAAAAAALEQAGASRFIDVRVEEVLEERFRQERRGRPGADTRYRRLTRTRHRLRFAVREDVVAADARSDGCFPLITNERETPAAELLAAYKYQPNLERRHAQLKGTQLVAPVFLHDAARIEGLLCCHFIALLVQALIEREIRAAMADRGLGELSLYPEDRACPAPSARRILAIFSGLARHHLLDAQGRHVQTFPPELTKLQLLVLDLLGVPEQTYR
jgi:transposase